MIGGVTRHMLPHLPGVPHLHVNRLLATNKRVRKIYSVTICQQKTKIVPLQGASNIGTAAPFCFLLSFVTSLL